MGIEINNKKNRVCGSDVLKDNGFEVISDFVNDNIYKKDNILYRLAFPVWNGKKVRIEKI